MIVEPHFMNDQTNIESIIVKYLNGTITADEHHELTPWLEQSSENQLVFDQMREIWLASEMAGGKFDFDFQAAFEQFKKKTASSKSIPQFHRSPFRRSVTISYRWAAVILLFIIVGGTVLFNFIRHKHSSSEEMMEYVTYNEVITGRGEIKTFYLPDSSKISLNANSIVKYPTVFNPTERYIELSGEAILEVKSDPDHPFVVKTKDTKVMVLGTVFDVKAYDEDNLMMVTVQSGSVSVEMNKAKMILAENDQFIFNKMSGDIGKITVDPQRVMSWIDRILYFNRTPLHEVVNMLNRYYPQLDLELAKGEYTSLISGEHDNKSAESVLTSIIYLTGVKCKKLNTKHILYQ